MLEQGRVSVNGATQKTAKHHLGPGDLVELSDHARLPARVRGIAIRYEDPDLMVIEKPPGLLTVATLHEKEHTVYAYLQQRLKEGNAKGRLFVVHRLDKFASGLLVFAKSEAVKIRLQALFRKHEIQRQYWAIVEGKVRKDRDTVRSHLAEDRSGRMHSTVDLAAGKHAITHFRVLRRFSNLTTLEVTLETGRKNQIRAHLAEQGHPIVGDEAYGSTLNPMGRLGLHAFLLGFEHPTDHTALLFQTDPPPEFRRYLPGRGDRPVARVMRPK
jgi:23S rRNA pseudouridine1911/1915/1917 synthase